MCCNSSVTDQLDLCGRRRVELARRGALGLDQRKLLALDQRRVVHGARKRRRTHLVGSGRDDRRGSDRPHCALDTPESRDNFILCWSHSG
jgi:hypothetical protein